VSILIGTHFHPANAEGLRRQAQAMDALRALDEVEIVDLQWEPMPDKRPWIRTVCDLRVDSRGASGCDGRRKPVVSDVMRALAVAAKRGGHSSFMYINADIVVTPAALSLVRANAKQAYAFSRLDVDRDSGRELETTLSGIDALVFDLGWWREHQHRFRPYILGEACWDVVYASVAMCHADGLLAASGEIRHERHPTEWGQSAFADYNGYLAAIDSRYFSLWCEYYERLKDLRARGGSRDEERALARDTFVWRRSAAAAARQLGRNVKARLSYGRKRAHWNRARPEAS
jgi:hypothetical protein